MDKIKKIRKQTWKYFWEQKWEEINDNLKNIFLVSLLISLFLQYFWVPFEPGGKPMWVTGAIIGLCMIGFWVLIGVIALIKCIVKWLKSNWQEAKEKAEEEFKK